jgi:hypothetical protein
MDTQTRYPTLTATRQLGQACQQLETLRAGLGASAADAAITDEEGDLLREAQKIVRRAAKSAQERHALMLHDPDYQREAAQERDDFWRSL